MLEGVSHITFIVSDISRMSQLLVEVLDGTEVYDSGARTYSISREKYFIVGGVWIAVMEGASLPDRSYNHIAFKVAEDAFDDYVRRIRDAGLEIRKPRPRVEGEGRSIYFYDHDNHLFELHTGTLDVRLARYRMAPQDVE